MRQSKFATLPRAAMTSVRRISICSFAPLIDARLGPAVGLRVLGLVQEAKQRYSIARSRLARNSSADKTGISLVA